jgi:hypothetical protein
MQIVFFMCCSVTLLIFNVDNCKKRLGWITSCTLQMQTSPVSQTLHSHLLLITTSKDKAP